MKQPEKRKPSEVLRQLMLMVWDPKFAIEDLDVSFEEALAVYRAAVLAEAAKDAVSDTAEKPPRKKPGRKPKAATETKITEETQ